MDRFELFGLGRRRGWLLVSQAGIILSLVGISLVDVKTHIFWLAIMAVFTAFCSASQDIVIDAYRREILPDEELGLGASVYLFGYRIALLTAGAGALFFADMMPWTQVYWVMAGFMGIGVLVACFAPEPKVEVPPPQNFRESVIEPLMEFFRRDRVLLILAFAFCYKIGESIASEMYMTFYMKTGFTNSEIATVAKVFGVWTMIAGSLVGGLIMVRVNIYRSLWIFGVLQAVALLAFAWLATTGKSLTMLAVAIGLENFTSGMATAAFLAFLAMQTNKRFSATQYALLSSFVSFSGIFLAGFTGALADALGWPMFFITCFLITIPGLLLLFPLKKLLPN